MPDTDQIVNVLLLLMVGAAAIEDLKTGRINIILAAAGTGLCLSLQLLSGMFRFGDAALGAGVGVLMLLLGYASSQAIGYGDGVILTATGCVLGGSYNFLLLLCSLLFSALYSIVVLILRRRKKTDRIPFVPFVLGGLVLLTGVYKC